MKHIIKWIIIFGIITGLTILGYYGYQEFKKWQALRKRTEKMVGVGEAIGKVVTFPLKIVPGAPKN